jgi:rod shape-determining protein MreD
MLKTLLSSLLLLLSLLLIETVILANITYLPAVPDMLLIAVMYLALKNGTLVGETTGFISGLLLDFVSGAPLGLNCLARTVLGYFCGLFNRTLNSAGIFIPALLGFCITILKITVLNIISFFYPQGQILVYNIFSLQFASELGLNAIIAPVLFAFFSLFHYLLIKSENMENLL